MGELPVPVLDPQSLPPLLHKHAVNVNGAIKRRYLDDVVPAITSNLGVADDGNYGSAATRDVEVLQAVSRRVHFGRSAVACCGNAPAPKQRRRLIPSDLLSPSQGMFVAESKFLSAPHLFIPHILNPNPERLLAYITKPEVEAALLVRLGNKAHLYGQELDPMGHPIPDDGISRPGKLDAKVVVKLYEEFVIPLTKDVEVRCCPSSICLRLPAVASNRCDASSLTDCC
jgi:chorismate mutase